MASEKKITVNTDHQSLGPPSWLTRSPCDIVLREPAALGASPALAAIEVKWLSWRSDRKPDRDWQETAEYLTIDLIKLGRTLWTSKAQPPRSKSAYLLAGAPADCWRGEWLERKPSGVEAMLALFEGGVQTLTTLTDHREPWWQEGFKTNTEPPPDPPNEVIDPPSFAALKVARVKMETPGQYGPWEFRCIRVERAGQPRVRS